MSNERIYLFKRFERFWHWSQALFIITLLVTGFRIHGWFSAMGFVTALRVHSFVAWALVVLWVFAIFWHFTTGEWKHYIPTMDKVFAVTRHYAWGMFHGEHHPYHPTPERKHNALQRFAYLWVKLMINPIIWVSGAGLLFYSYNWTALDGIGLQAAAWTHTAGAYMMLFFFIVHIYLATAGHTPLAHIKAMITGWEDRDE